MGVQYTTKTKVRRRPNGVEYLVIYRKYVDGFIHVEQCPILLHGIMNGVRCRLYACRRTGRNVMVNEVKTKRRPILETEVATIVQRFIGVDKTIHAQIVEEDQIQVAWSRPNQGDRIYETTVYKSGDGNLKHYTREMDTAL